jgi:hypothetical protein
VTDILNRNNRRKHSELGRLLLVLIPVLLLCIALFYALSVPRHGKIPPAQGGILDLRHVDFSDSLYFLDGEWEFYYGRFYTPEDFSNGIFAGIPAGKTFINVPMPWNEAGYPKYGYATYRLFRVRNRDLTGIKICSKLELEAD